MTRSQGGQSQEKEAKLSLSECRPWPHPTYWDTQATSSSVLNTIWLVLLLCTTSPFTRQQIFKLCGSEMQKQHLGVLCSSSNSPCTQLGQESTGCLRPPCTHHLAQHLPVVTGGLRRRCPDLQGWGEKNCCFAFNNGHLSTVEADNCRYKTDQASIKQQVTA